MSRHRMIRDMDLGAARQAVDDDDYGGDDALSPEDELQMNHGLEVVLELVGPSSETGIPDSAIRDALWEYYFDINQTVEWVYEEKARLAAAQERKVVNREPRTPFDFSGINIRSLAENENNSAHRLALARMQINRVHMPSMRQPLIHLAQQQEQPLFEEYDDNESYGSFGPPVEGNRLSTITEKTELRTVDSRSHVGYSPGRQESATPRYSLTAQSLAAQNQRLSARPLSHMTGISASTMDYGNVIQGHFSHKAKEPPLADPDEIPPSPSESALLRLSVKEAPPSAASSETRSTPPTSPLKQLPPMDTMPDIPDSGSLLSRMGAPLNQPSPSIPPPASIGHIPHTPRSYQPKLVAPAQVDRDLSVESAKRSQSESKPKSKLSALASSRTSMYTTSSRSESLVEGSILTYPDLRPSARSVFSLRPPSTTITESSVSGYSEIARNAVAAALQAEADDKAAAERTPVRSSAVSDAGSDRTVKAEPPVATETPREASPEQSKPPSKPLSKLQLLAQAKNANSQAKTLHFKSKPKSHGPTTNDLAHRTHTQYLTPIANGPSVTTAITTSYQTLASLANSHYDPSPSATPVSTIPLGYPSDPPKSKLAMKSRKYKTPGGAIVVEEAPYSPPADMPIFMPRASTRARASPSAFASLLANDDIPQDDKSARHSRKTDGSSSKRRSKSKVPQPPTTIQVSPNAYAFNDPSPDDKVHNARIGTALGQPRDSRSGATASSRSSTKAPL